jgi:hypothetical protein
VCWEKLEKDIAERDRLVAELDEDGREESTGILFFGVLKIKKEIGHVRWPSVRDAFDILDNRRAGDSR